MIKLHPSPAQLAAFVDGDSSPAMSLVIAAHVDMCEECQQRVTQIQEAASEAALADLAMSSGFDQMLADITQLPVAASESVLDAVPKSIELDGRQFELPRALRRYVSKTGNWSHLIGNLYQAPVDLGPVGKANFIYMNKGGSVPEHTHRGSELTLVINGEFTDGINHYDSGDFIMMDSSHTHAPMSEVDEGCLVFSVVDQPLHFTQGIARLLNPFSHLFFK